MGGIDPPSQTHPAGGADPQPLTGASDHFGLGGERWSARPEDEFAPGTDLGGVVIVRLLARGGMGAVYEARQIAPPRTVAVKVVRDGLRGRVGMRRFEYEARVLARLRHPHIAQIHTLGTFASARGPVPYIVMELVEGGRPVTEHAAAAGLPIRERVAVFHRACAGVAHGHRKGVIHRDLKPGNVLVDAAGEPKVIDFGVARTLDPEVTAATASGDLVGTLQYMSPEQLGADPDEIDARTDVYALGLVLHELLAGELPYDLRGKSPLEAARILDGRTAATPAVIERAVRAEGRLRPDEGRSLAAIVARCLEPRPADRYATAVEVEAELGRWLAGEEVLARPLGTLEALRRLARRHRAAAVAAAVGFAAIVVAMAGIAVFSVRAERERRVAVEARAAAEAGRREADRRTAEAREQLYVSNVLLAAEARDRDNLAEAARLLDAARGLADSAGTARPLELDCLAASLDESAAVLRGHRGTVTAVAWSPDGRRLATGGEDGRVRIVQPLAGGEEAVVIAAHSKTIWGLAFSPDGRLVASGSPDGSAGVWDGESGRLVTRLDGHDAAVYAVAFSADGGLVATGGKDRTVRLWDTASWREREVLTGHEGTVHAAAFSAAGDLLVTASQDGTVRLWDVATGRQRTVLEGHEGRVFAVAIDAAARRLVTASDDGTARLWDLAGGAATVVLRHPFRVNAVAFVGDGRRVATASGDGLLRVWDAASGAELARLRGHVGRLWSLAVAPGTARVATGSDDETARLWDPDGGLSPVVVAADRMLAVAFSPDGGELAVGTAAAELLACDAATLRIRDRLADGSGRVNGLAYAPDGCTLAAACDDGAVRCWPRPGAGPPQVARRHGRRVFSVAFSADGERMATASEDRTARIWRAASGDPACEPLRHPARVYAAAFSPDGRLVATACEDGGLRLWDAASGAARGEIVAHEAAVNWVAFAADGSRIATASSDGTVRLWSVPACRPLAVLTGPARQVWKVAFSPDGTRVAAVSADGTAQLWDAASGRAVTMLRGHSDQVWGLAFPPDGRALATASWDGTTRLWGVAAAALASRRAVEQDR